MHVSQLCKGSACVEYDFLELWCRLIVVACLFQERALLHEANQLRTTLHLLHYKRGKEALHLLHKGYLALSLRITSYLSEATSNHTVCTMSFVPTVGHIAVLGTRCIASLNTILLIQLGLIGARRRNLLCQNGDRIKERIPFFSPHFFRLGFHDAIFFYSHCGKKRTR